MWLEPGLDIPNDQCADWGLCHSYPALIAQSLGYEIANYAMGGGSNDAVFRIWAEIQDKVNPDDIVIACWTGRHRTEVWHDDHGIWLQVAPNTKVFRQREPHAMHLSGLTVDVHVKHMEQFLDFTHTWNTFANHPIAARNNKIKNIISLNHWAGSLGVRVINLHSFDPLLDHDMSHSILAKFEWPVADDFMDFCEGNGYDKTVNGHYFLPAHNSYADTVLRHLNG